ncbi:MAG: FtsX-like permease family protein [Balneolaceae bacterium]|nr:MAG: FtsX-like permease family protein [Balneolaceae bacterium]
MNFFRELLSPYSWKLAYRDSKSQWKSLIIYTSSVVAGVAALVAILSFRNDVLLTVDDQSRELLGADLELRSTQPFHNDVIAFIDSTGGSDASAWEFNSMVLFNEAGATRLSQVRAIEGVFPLYGKLSTEPAEAAFNYQQNNSALVEQSAMSQFNISVGDTIRVGNRNLAVEGALLSVPGEAAAFSLVGPRIYLPKRAIEGTGLLDRGSRVEYKHYFQFNDAESLTAFTEAFRPLAREHQVRMETVESRISTFEAIVNNLTRFLGLIAFIALLLGGLGVGSAIYIYIKRKTATVATLRCLGMTKEKILAVFAIQVALLGFMGALSGTGIGIILQFYIPTLFADLLPFQITQAISFEAISLGLFTGVLISVIFSLMPLASVSAISPLLTLRSTDFSPIGSLPKRVKFITLSISLAVLIFIVGLLTDSYIASLVFTLSLFLFVLLLWGVAAFLIATVKSLRLKSFSYTVRQGMANLFRPNNQTNMLITTLGMGMLLIGTLYLSQDMLLQRINLETGDDTPDLVFYDIQMDQNDRLNELITEEGATVIQNVPIVSMRLSSRKGQSVQEIRQDTTVAISNWVLSREYRVTYREELNEAETILRGEWIGQAEGLSSVIPISISTQIEDELQLQIGDTLGFNVQGVPITTTIASVREVDFQRPEPNFFVVFPAGVLEQAPQFFASTVKITNDAQSVRLQSAVVNELPNVSVIDISVALASVREFLDKVSMAVQFMALFSIFTGFIVLASSIAISRRQRTKESVLLRTLGANNRQVGSIQTIEYALLGLLSSLTGLLLAIAASWGLAYFYFDLAFVPDFLTLTAITLFIMLLAILIGWSGSRHIFKHSPLEILRLQTD